MTKWRPGPGCARSSWLDEIHRDRTAEPVSAGVVFGATHMPAVAAHLGGKLGYIAASSEWLTVAHGKS